MREAVGSGAGKLAQLAETHKAAVPVPPSPRPTTQPPIQPIKLVGLNQSQTTNLLGPPMRERDANPGQIWEYRTQACTLQVHFFFNMGAREFQALHYEAAANPASFSAADQCLAQVHDQARKR
ncbi:MAG: hypothetical protein FJX35_07655 [Alphaproteobacteria bacterium]|nr:hypothetical protein [Alphaproteobacteria bacterium]